MSPDRKKLYMWLSVGGTALVIFLVWISSIKYSIRASMIDFSVKKNQSLDSFLNAKADLEEQFLQIKETLNNLKATSTNEAATSTNNEIGIKN